MKNYFKGNANCLLLALLFLLNCSLTLAQMEPVNVKNLGALANGINDDTKFIQDAIKSAYNASLSNTGWREPIKIIIPAGHYKVTRPLIDANSGIPAGKFVFEGEGWQNTIIEFKPNSENFLFDNKQIFGFTTFSGIEFRSNQIGKLMNGVGGGTGNAQSFIFDKCSFQNWNNIITSTGGTMMSEVTFRDCKINGSNEKSILFNLNNAQGVNWRFFATDIESIRGIVFNFLQSSTINIYQGSFIPQGNGIVFNIPSNANRNSFGPNNTPQVNCNGARFEMHDKSQLINIKAPKVNIGFDFYSCGMGGHNITNQFVIETTDFGRISFINCDNFSKYKFKHTIDNSSSYVNPLKITFINNSPSLGDLKQSECTQVVNDAGSPIYSFINCGINGDIRPFANSSYFVPDNYVPLRVSKNIFSSSPSNNYTAFPVKNNDYTEVWRIKIPDVNILAMRLYIVEGNGQSSQNSEFDLKLTNKDGGVIFIQDIYSTQRSQRVYEWNKAVYQSKSDELILYFKPKSYNANKYGIKSFIVLEY